MLSWIQRHALLVLLRQNDAQVKDLRPRDVPNNLFAYHLDGLVRDGYIAKTERATYNLTPKGLKLCGTFSTATDAQCENTKTVIMLYGKRSDQYLLFRWSRQPYLGQVTMLYDRLPFGKRLEDGIHSAMSDKLGVALPVEFMQSILVRIAHNDELISHMNALVYKVDISTVKLPIVSRNGEAYIAPLSQDDCMQGLRDTISQLERGLVQPFEITWSY